MIQEQDERLCAVTKGHRPSSDCGVLLEASLSLLWRFSAAVGSRHQNILPPFCGDCVPLCLKDLVHFETPRLHLRRMILNDVPALLHVLGDAEVMRFYPAPFDEARMLRWGAWNQQHYAEHDHGLLAVILRATAECIADCGLGPRRWTGCRRLASRNLDR